MSPMSISFYHLFFCKNLGKLTATNAANLSFVIFSVFMNRDQTNTNTIDFTDQSHTMATTVAADGWWYFLSLFLLLQSTTCPTVIFFIVVTYFFTDIPFVWRKESPPRPPRTIYQPARPARNAKIDSQKRTAAVHYGYGCWWGTHEQTMSLSKSE